MLARTWWSFRDRNPGYAVRLDLDGATATREPRPLRVGFGRVKINPDLSDPRRPVWLAGFSQHRAATAIHDDLWAVAVVLDDGHTRLGVVALDAIGFFHDDVIAVRRQLAADLKLDYTIVCATHNHSTPDLMGLWGPDLLHSGIDPAYRQQVIDAAAKAVAAAVGSLQPAQLALHEIRTPPENIVTDTRKPIVFDADIRMMHFTRPDTGATLGTLVGWGNHPETVWSKNTEITADFPGALRDALEHGVTHEGRQLAAGLGGVHVFVNGAVGGLMTTHPTVTVEDPYLKKEIRDPSHAKSVAVGRQLASRILARLAEPGAAATTHAPIAIRARTLSLPVDNKLFLLAPILGVLDRGHTGWLRMRTEVALVTVGEASIACIPGEIYPEIVNGGVERAEGGDFGIAPVEVPSLRELMPGKVKFVFGLANDEVGYIIPKSEWDQRPPYLYGAKKPVYGEVNSLGPETAPLLHAALRELCAKAK
ncbi:MAG: hypothetical protein HZA93_29205 [Verrucomicrobia bacterium]|nr:hypothetical protein [Verrucomicrobiota bacterium]